MMAEYKHTVISWDGTAVRFLDQTALPLETRVTETEDYRVMLEAIRRLRVRGAPLIGIAAAYGVCAAAREHAALPPPAFVDRMLRICDEFAATRPTAVNLFWALEQMREVLRLTGTVRECIEALTVKAISIHEDDDARCAAIGRHGAALLPAGAGVLTHCNTGALATGGDGTAFNVLLQAHRDGRGIHVYADETRPLLQGARLTMWELAQHGIPSTLITDGTAPMLMRQGRVQAVITGADRIAGNGDTANKIGTYGLAVAAAHHGIPMYIAAPLSTFDMSIASGEDIPIEERDGDEVTHCAASRIAPAGVPAYAPAFDVTPAGLIHGIITERGVVSPPYRETLRALHA
jgi:methylthioribose-1-phosphate isomerase